MPESDQEFYQKVISRVRWNIFAFGLVGAAAAAYLRTIEAGLAFLIGAALSYLSFWGWQQLVNALSPGAKKRSPVSFIARTLLLVGLAYVVVRFLGLNIAVAAMGLLVSAAAVVAELVYELINRRA
jgi:hypothetical protein